MSTHHACTDRRMRGTAHRLLAALVAVIGAVSLTFGLAPTSFAEDSGGTVDMYRMYNPNSGEHFYTGKTTERDQLRGSGWKYEGVGWVAPAQSDTPVYRLYNPNASDHHYTTSAEERDQLLQAGWTDEGIGWYSSDTNRGFTVYRQYNPNAKSGAHNYTLDSGEASNLIAHGWRDEGVAWYAIGGATPAPVDPTPTPAPKPNPNPNPTPTLPGRQVTPGAHCKKIEVGQLGTAHGKIYVCKYGAGDKIPRWYPR
ncbi:hypothetical protein [Bifidobacterium sp. UTBIF-78]|uniref:hypothetical protein n=1 Tax=Bifidobacterium sp. UTBIF-78 TaxID=1465263 RepID=UPI0015E3B8BC|nr:hypothetical protein [Bifidobacterium sp. UTBIF-78]